MLHRYNFYLSAKRFIAINFYGETLFNTSLLLLFKRNSSLNALSLLLLKVTLPSSAGAILYRLYISVTHSGQLDKCAAMTFLSRKKLAMAQGLSQQFLFTYLLHGSVGQRLACDGELYFYKV
jgi:hypothetical protein